MMPKLAMDHATNTAQNVVRLVLAFTVLSTSIAETFGFKCFEDFCQSNHYCYEKQERCKNCDDAKHLCLGPLMPTNCTNFCTELEVERRLKLEKDKPCDAQALPVLENGVYNYSASATYPQGSTVTMTCEHGFSLHVPVSAIKCGPYGQWTDVPVCQANFCTLTKMDGYIVQPDKHQYAVSDSVRITCTGNNKPTVELHCDPNGMWNRSIPSCISHGDIINNMMIAIGILGTLFVISACLNGIFIVLYFWQWKTKINKHNLRPQAKEPEIENLLYTVGDPVVSVNPTKSKDPHQEVPSNPSQNADVSDGSAGAPRQDVPPEAFLRRNLPAPSNIMTQYITINLSEKDGGKKEQSKEPGNDKDSGSSHQPNEANTYKHPVPATS